jgi:Galactose oxidase, central domain
MVQDAFQQLDFAIQPGWARWPARGVRSPNRSPRYSSTLLVNALGDAGSLASACQRASMHLRQLRPRSTTTTVRAELRRVLMLPVRPAFLAMLGFAACGQEPAPAADGLTQLGSLQVGRALHTATLLPDGRLLIAGGGTPEQPIRSAELYDPAQGVSQFTGDLNVARLGHSATLLPNGTVLIIGGYGSGVLSSGTAEIYDPDTGAFRMTGAPREPRSDHSALLLSTGQVLVVGGDVSGNGSLPTRSVELYDPKTESFDYTGSMATARRPYGVVKLKDSRVLVPGGTTGRRAVTATAEIYDPTSGVFTRTGSLNEPREKHAAVVLPDSRVMILGGNVQADGEGLTSTELFEPSTGRFAPGPEMHGARYKTAVVRLGDGSVLVVGGNPLLAERLDSTTGGFLPVTGPEALRFFPALTALRDGSALITGGYAAGGSQASVWRFDPGS